MPPGRVGPIPGHPHISSLDSAFDNAPYLVGWLHKLWDAYSESVNIDYGIAGENPYGSRAFEEYGVETSGLATEEYFYPADVLSGQNIETMQEIYSCLEMVRCRNADGVISQHVYNDFFNDIGRVLDHWSGVTADIVHEYHKDLNNFYPEHQKATGELAKCIVAYSGIVQEARKDVNSAMGQAYDSFEARYYSFEYPSAYLVSLLQLLASVVLGLKFNPIEEKVFMAVLGPAIDQAVPKSGEGGKKGPEIIQGNLAEIARSYVSAANEICVEARGQIDQLSDRVYGEANTTLNNMGPVPRPQAQGGESAGVSYDLESMKGLVSTTQATIEHFEGNSRTLQRCVSLLESGYPLLGGAGKSGDFFEVGKRFNEAVTSTCHRLHSFNEAFVQGQRDLLDLLRTAHQNYTTNELHTTEMFNRIGQQIV